LSRSGQKVVTNRVLAVTGTAVAAFPLAPASSAYTLSRGHRRSPGYALWRILAGGLIGTFVVTCASVYLAVSSAPQSPRDAARVYAQQTLTMLWPASACASRCAVDVLGPAAPDAWRVRLTAPTWQRCLIVDVKAFVLTREHGVTGVHPASCG
jgi:hypothetical protein